MTLGAKLKRAREAAGLTQAEAARVIGCKQPTVSDYESGKKEPMIGLYRKSVEDFLERFGGRSSAEVGPADEAGPVLQED